MLDQADIVLHKSEKVDKINNCLNANGLYHNDLNSGNIMVDKDTKQIIIIDFGEATSTKNHVANIK